jgi:hypothetical protein
MSKIRTFRNVFWVSSFRPNKQRFFFSEVESKTLLYQLGMLNNPQLKVSLIENEFTYFRGHRFSQNANQKLPRFLPYPLINFQGRNLGNFWLVFWEKR